MQVLQRNFCMLSVKLLFWVPVGLFLLSHDFFTAFWANDLKNVLVALIFSPLILRVYELLVTVIFAVLIMSSRSKMRRAFLCLDYGKIIDRCPRTFFLAKR